MAESQNIEYKESWRDEYLKWVCGFANAQGGKIYIGCDDNGEVVGVKDAKRLMEEIPNKIRDGMGIIVAVSWRRTGCLILKSMYLLIRSVFPIRVSITTGAAARNKF